MHACVCVRCGVDFEELVACPAQVGEHKYFDTLYSFVSYVASCNTNLAIKRLTLLIGALLL
jgi:hypothetical protein